MRSSPGTMVSEPSTRAQRGSALNTCTSVGVERSVAMIPIVLAAVAGCLVARAFAAAPVITRIEPSAAIPAETTECILAGENLNGAVELWTSFPCEVSAADRAGGPAFRLKVPADVPPGLGMIRLITTNGVSNPQLFLIDSIPQDRKSTRLNASH